MLGEHVVDDHGVKAAQDRSQNGCQLVDQPLELSGTSPVPIGHSFARSARAASPFRDVDKTRALRQRPRLAPTGDHGDRVAGLDKGLRMRLDHSFHPAHDRWGGVMQNGNLEDFSSE